MLKRCWHYALIATILVGATAVPLTQVHALDESQTETQVQQAATEEDDSSASNTNNLQESPMPTDENKQNQNLNLEESSTGTTETPVTNTGTGISDSNRSSQESVDVSKEASSKQTNPETERNSQTSSESESNVVDSKEGQQNNSKLGEALELGNVNFGSDANRYVSRTDDGDNAWIFGSKTGFMPPTPSVPAMGAQEDVPLTIPYSYAKEFWTHLLQNGTVTLRVWKIDLSADGLSGTANSYTTTTVSSTIRSYVNGTTTHTFADEGVYYFQFVGTANRLLQSPIVSASSMVKVIVSPHTIYPDTLDITAQTPILMSSQGSYPAEATVTPAAANTTVSWHSDGSKIKIDDAHSTGISTLYSAPEQNTVNELVDQSGLASGYIEASMPTATTSLTARKAIAVGGLKAIEIEKSAIEPTGLLHSINASNSLPKGQTWSYKWTAFKYDPASGALSNEYNLSASESGVTNSSGTGKKDPTDNDVKINISPTGKFTTEAVKATKAGTPYALRLTFTTTIDNQTLTYMSNYATLKITEDPGQLSLTSVPTEATADSYSLVELYQGQTRDAKMVGNLSVSDTRPDEDTTATRWHLTAKATGLQKNNSPESSALPFNYQLNGSDITDSIALPGNETSTPITDGSTHTNLNTDVNLKFLPQIPNNMNVRSGDYQGTITWELQPATKQAGDL